MKNFQLNKKYSLDTNILVYATDTDSPYFEKVSKLLDFFDNQKLEIYLSEKVLYEYYAVLSRFYFKNRPKRAVEFFNFYKNHELVKICFNSLESLELVENWLNLSDTQVRYIYDLVLLSSLITNQVDVLITNNPKDFPQTPALEILDLDSL